MTQNEVRRHKKQNEVRKDGVTVQVGHEDRWKERGINISNLPRLNGGLLLEKGSGCLEAALKQAFSFYASVLKLRAKLRDTACSFYVYQLSVGRGTLDVSRFVLDPSLQPDLSFQAGLHGGL